MAAENALEAYRYLSQFRFSRHLRTVQRGEMPENNVGPPRSMRRSRTCSRPFSRRFQTCKAPSHAATAWTRGRSRGNSTGPRPQSGLRSYYRLAGFCSRYEATVRSRSRACEERDIHRLDKELLLRDGGSPPGVGRTTAPDTRSAESRRLVVAQDDVGGRQRQGGQGDRDAVEHELYERDLLPRSLAHAGDDHVGGGADEGQVAAEVRA